MSEDASRVVEAVVLLHDTAKDLGCKPGSVRELANAVADLERQGMDTTLKPAVAFDGPRFMAAIDALRDHYGIANQNKLAEIVGVGHGCFTRLREGKGVEFDVLIKILAWSKLDVRSYIAAATPSAEPTA